jgi:hypothetical protein
MEFITTETTYGKLRGRREDGVNIFKGETTDDTSTNP